MSFGGSRGFGSMKWSADIALKLKGDSHKHDCVNFFRPKANSMSSGFTSLNVDVSNSNGIVRDEAFVITFQGLKVQECACGVVCMWRIEGCPPSSNTHCHY
jgi:hypothetical protein